MKQEQQLDRDFYLNYLLDQYNEDPTDQGGKKKLDIILQGQKEKIRSLAKVTELMLQNQLVKNSQNKTGQFQISNEEIDSQQIPPVIQFNTFNLPKEIVQTNIQDLQPNFLESYHYFTIVIVLFILVIFGLLYLILKIIREHQKSQKQIHEHYHKLTLSLKTKAKRASRKEDEEGQNSTQSKSNLSKFSDLRDRRLMKRKYSNEFKFLETSRKRLLLSHGNFQRSFKYKTKFRSNDQLEKQQIISEKRDFNKKMFKNNNESMSSQQELSKQKDPTDSFKLFYENQKFDNCFSKKQRIGRGAFGSVYKVMHKLEGYFYAVKQIQIRVKNDQDLRQLPIFREIATMVNLQHKNIVRFITSWAEKNEKEESIVSSTLLEQSNFTKQTKTNELSIHFGDTDQPITITQNIKEELEDIDLFIQMEFCEGMSLDSYLINQNYKIDLSLVYFIFIQLLEGIIYIHSKGVIHRDLKP